MRSDIVPGAVFPDYELTDHRGTRRKLSELQLADPLVLVLARGGFCPKDRRQHEGLVQLHREMQVGYCRLVTISTDNLLETNEFRAGVGGYWFFGRPTVEELRLDLRAVLQRCRPDWDISRAEQRTAWTNGEKTDFYPYGKTQAQVLARKD